MLYICLYKVKEKTYLDIKDRVVKNELNKTKIYNLYTTEAHTNKKTHTFLDNISLC